jgi:predicted SprT family Zn-dependent metalloprotease
LIKFEQHPEHATLNYWQIKALRVLLRATASRAPKDTMLRVDGKPFRCECGCNVFRPIGVALDGEKHYRCNSCDAVLAGF